jgi:hypothetical protein
MGNEPSMVTNIIFFPMNMQPLRLRTTGQLLQEHADADLPLSPLTQIPGFCAWRLDLADLSHAFSFQH